MTPDLDRNKLAKLLAMFSSSFDGEVTSAARKAHTLVMGAALTWEQVLLEPEPVVSFRDWWPPPSSSPPPPPPKPEKKPPGWYSKSAQQARKAAKEAQRAADKAALAARTLERALRCRARADELSSFDVAILNHIVRGDPLTDDLLRQLDIICEILERIDASREAA